MFYIKQDQIAPSAEGTNPDVTGKHFEKAIEVIIWCLYINIKIL